MPLFNDYTLFAIINNMLEDIQDQSIRLAVLDIMLALYNKGITEIHLGGMMRLLGVANEVAAEHDESKVVLDDEFAKYVTQITDLAQHNSPSDILH